MADVNQQVDKVSLTEREREILRLLITGQTDRDIAEETILTVGTVKWYNRQIYNKLGVRNRTEASTRAQQLGLLRSPAQPAALIPRSTPTHNLPAQITSFIGRSHELTVLKSSLLESRLVTLTGPPGAGKTRLALEVAATLLDYYRDGIYFVSLAPIQDAGLVAHMVAQALGIKESRADSVVTVLKAALHDKHLLLVLDNFEHLLTAAPLVSDLLAAAPHLTVLVTSRENLRLYGEQEFPVPPLQLPDLRQRSSAAALQSYEAVELFLRRAHAAQPDFVLNDDNAPSVAMICVHLDGLPLAIELAAAHIKFYAPSMLLLRLGHRLEALGEGARDLPARQRTLRATLAWSYDLLTAEEQHLFARLGVFVGGFGIDDAEVVCGNGLGVEIATGLESLLTKSLLGPMPGAFGEPRFTLLETLREYALEKLIEHDESERIYEQHARHFLALAERAAWDRNTPRESEWLTRFEAQQDNLRAALNWFYINDNDGQASLRFVTNLTSFWRTRGNPAEGRSRFAEALRLKGADTLTQARAEALRSAGAIAYLQCDYSAARGLYLEALDIDRAIGDQRGIANTLIGLADMETAIGAYDTAEPMFQQAIQIMQQIGDQGGVAGALCLLAWCPLRSRGDYPQAIAWLEKGLALYQQMGNKVGTALAYSGLGEIAVRQGEMEEATILLEQSLRLRQELGERWGIAASLGSLAWVAMHQDNFERAIALLSESLRIRKDIGDPGGMAWCLEKLAEIAYAQNDDGRAVRIFGAAAALRTSANSAIDPTDQPEHDRLIAGIRARLGGEIFEAVWAEGQGISLEALLEYLSLSPVDGEEGTE